LVPQGFAGRIDLSVPTERTDECRFIQSCASQSSCARWGKATVGLGFGDGSDNSKIQTLAGAMIQFQAGGNVIGFAGMIDNAFGVARMLHESPTTE